MLWTDPFAPLVTQMTRSAVFAPAADVTISDGDIVLTMDVPGLAADDLTIEIVDGFLTVQGERRRPQLPEGTTWGHAERTFGRFERRFKVPQGIDPDAITASIDNGVLSLIVPKPERMRPRTIAIEAGRRQRQLETTGS